MKTDINKLLNIDFFYKITLLGFVLSLPLWREVNTIMLWLWGIAWLLIPIQEKKQNFNKNKPVLTVFLSLYLAYAYLSLHNCPTYCNFNQLGQSLGLLLIPAFVLTVDAKRFNKKVILKTLGIGLFASIIISWSHVLITIYHRPFPFIHELQYFFQWIYTGENLLKPLHFHPSYFAVLLVFFLASLIYQDVFAGFRNQHLKFYFTVFVLFVFLLATNSRVAIISFLMIVVIETFRKNFSPKKTAILIIFIGLLLIGMTQIDFLHKKIINLLTGEERIYRWQAIADLFFKQDNWFLGLGNHNATELYLQAYKNNGFTQAFKESYNAHNQFLEFLFKAGIAGLLIFIGSFVMFARKTLLKKEALYFIIIFIIFAMGESYLQRVKGVFLFAFFYSLLIQLTQTNKHETQT